VAEASRRKKRKIEKNHEDGLKKWLSCRLLSLNKHIIIAGFL